MTDHVYFFDNQHGKPFMARLVRKGEAYGLNRCLTHDESDPLVEFYAVNQKRNQFVSRYYLSTLNAHDLDCGICLDGGIPAWTISAENAEYVIGHCNETMALEAAQ